MPTPPALEILLWLSMVKGLAKICPVVPKERTCCFCHSVVCFLASLVCEDAVLDGLEAPGLLLVFLPQWAGAGILLSHMPGVFWVQPFWALLKHVGFLCTIMAWFSTVQLALHLNHAFCCLLCFVDIEVWSDCWAESSLVTQNYIFRTEKLPLEIIKGVCWCGFFVVLSFCPVLFCTWRSHDILLISVEFLNKLIYSLENKLTLCCSIKTKEASTLTLHS